MPAQLRPGAQATASRQRRNARHVEGAGQRRQIGLAGTGVDAAIAGGAIELADILGRDETLSRIKFGISKLS